MGQILELENTTRNLGNFIPAFMGALEMKKCDNCGEEVEAKNEHVIGWCRGETYYSCENKEA